MCRAAQGPGIFDQFRRQRCAKLHGLTRRRVHEGQSCGVQKVPLQRRQQLRTNPLLSRRAVQRIADHGTSERREVHTDLMCSSGVQVCFAPA